MAKERHQILERIHIVQLAGVDQRHEPVPDCRALQRAIKQAVFPEQNDPLQRLLGIRPGLLGVFGVESVNGFYLNAAKEVSADFGSPLRILSVGCGDGTVEVELAKSLREAGADFRLEGADLSPVLIERFQSAVGESSLQDSSRGIVR